MATIAQLQAELFRLDSLFIELSVQLDVAINQFGINSSQANQLRQQLDSNIQQQENALRQLNQLRDSVGTASAGQIQRNADAANDDGAKSQSPSAAPDVVAPDGRIQRQPADTVPTNAERNTQESDAGTNDRNRPTTETQATPAGSSASQTAGTPTNDDNTPVSTGQTANATQAAIDRKFGGRVTPQPNVLDQFASYTYQISLYLCSAGDYRRLLDGKQRSLAGFQLLMQSGGAPLDSGIIPPSQQAQSRDLGDVPSDSPTLSQGRNQYFPLDYYIDSLRIRNYVSGKGTQGSHGVAEVKFRITEPYGITLFENLYYAVQQYVTQGGGGGASSPQNYAAQTYLAVIRFYGYDEQGKLVSPRTNQPGQVTDSRAISEKLIPFRFTSIKFRIANRLTEYECEGVAVGNDVGTSQGTGVIPYNIELTATTLKDLLNGNQVTRTSANDATNRQTGTTTTGSSTAPPKADAAPQKTLVSGLSQALNDFQEQLKQKGEITYVNTYRFVFADPEIENAKVRPPGPANKTGWGMLSPQTAAEAKDGKKQTPNANSKNVSATAGMPIVQFLDLAVRNSTYVYDQQTKVVVDGQDIPQGSAQTPAWFKIDTEAKPKKDQFDPRRNDYAYDITYQISMYKVAQIKSDYFPQGKFLGTHKKYNYWFTGENTSILKFEQDFNYQFYLTVNSSQQVREVGSTSNYREYEKRITAPNSPESAQGQPGNTNEPGANAADYLYSPGDQAEVKLDIVGDPAWIQQGSVWYGVEGPDVKDPSQIAFLNDGTINYSSQEVLFEVAFNKPSDYDIKTGLMNIKKQGT